MDKDSKVGLGVRETREVAEYMQKAIKSRSRTDLPSTGWSLQFQQEVNNIVRIIKEALGNRSKC
jgi:methylmalonyl-CoA mutase N-terminal domain/subunit